MSNTKISIVVIDDHPVISHGLKSILGKRDEFVIAGEASDSRGALQIVAASKPDVIILDIGLDGSDGISLIAQLKEVSSLSKIIMYTMHDNKNYIARSFQAGAMAYVLKSDKTEELVDAVKNVFGAKIYLSSAIPSAVLAELIMGKKSLDSGVSGLTAREYEIASLISMGKNINQIAENLCISPKTVRVHRTNIMHKLSCDNVHELLLQLHNYFPQK